MTKPLYRLAALFREDSSQVATAPSRSGRGGEATNCLEIPHQPITNQFNSSNCSRLAQLTAGALINKLTARDPSEQIGSQLQAMYMNI